MNMAYRKLYALVFSTVIATASVHGMENVATEVDCIKQDVTTETVQAPVVWYKKGSVQAAAAALTLAVVGYALAVRMGKVALPAFVTGLVAVAQTTQDINPMDIPANDGGTQVIDVQVQDDVQPVSEETVDTNSNMNAEKIVKQFVDGVSQVVSSDNMKAMFQE